MFSYCRVLTIRVGPVGGCQVQNRINPLSILTLEIRSPQKIHYVPRSKHFSSRCKKQSAYQEQLKNCEKQILASSCLSVRPSVRPSICRHGNSRLPMNMIFMKFDIWVFFENLSRKYKFHYNRIRLTGTVMKTNIQFWSYLVHFFIKWEMFQTKGVEKIKIHF